ncbi:MAG: DUF4957 domain-containing protein [Bacteroidales bacterium]|nr:DUF4957 domain-containing protein [Bacteroidales bacterium]
MKLIKKLTYAFATVAVLLGLGSCDTPFNEITVLDLNRCLEPMNLAARVDPYAGDIVTFSWDVSKDAETYLLTVYTDAAMTQRYLTESVSPANVPYQKKLDADQTYYFTVQATASGKSDSKIAAYDKAIKTYAVKDNLYMKVAGRDANSVQLVWSNEVEDYLDVTHIEYGYPGEEPMGAIQLTDTDKSQHSATVDGLAASTEYVITLYYLSAERGRVDVWTMADTEGFTTVSSLDALKNAILTPGAKISLTMEGSPYDIEALDIANGFTLVGVESADGAKPVLQGELHIADTWTSGNDLYFEGVEFNGNPTALSPSGFGFAIQNKNGGTVKGKQIGNLTYKNCVLTNYSKGLIYEWGNDMAFGDVIYDSCEISNINADGTGGGDVFDIRQATSVGKLAFVNNTIFQGMRTFVRFDAGSIGELVFENNTLYNLDFVDNANNAGVFGLQITPGSFSFKNNLFLGMTGKAVLASANAKYVPASSMGVSAANNWFFGLPVDDSGNVTYFTGNFTQSDAAGTILTVDPCYNAAAGQFNIIPASEIAGKNVGAPKWWTPYVEEPEDLTLKVIEGNHTWNLANPKFFSGTIKKQMVRDQLFINTSDAYPIVVADGMLNFQLPAVTDRQGVPTVNCLIFKVNEPGSVVIKAADPGNKGGHFVVGVGPVAGGEIALKGGVSALADMDNATKIVISTITEESLVYIYPSGPVSLQELAWSTDLTPVNTALPTPAPKAAPAAMTQGEATDIVVSWDPVENAGSYSVVFSGKTYTVEETSYTVEGKTTGMLDPGSYKVEVYANPTKEDIYNTESAAGVATFAVLPAGGGGGDEEFVVASVEDLLNAIAAGKDAITLKYSDTPYEIGALTVNAPLHLKGQTNGDAKTKVTTSITLSGEIGGSVILSNLEFVGDGTSILVDDKTDVAPVADTVAIYDSYLHGTKALYDNSGKAASNVQYVIFKGNLIDDCSNGADFIDMRAGAHHNFQFENNTVANSCRTFIRTDAGHEMNTAVIRNNTFYKVATNSSSKDNNGIFHIRSAAGSGLYRYEVANNFFYSILIDTDPENAAGFPKLRSKGGITPITFSNNYYYNCEDREERAAYSFWAYVTKEESMADGGAIVPADPCVDAENGDFTLTNGVMMNAGVGDPRWNPAGGSTPSSEITVSDADALLTAISAGKKSITLEDGAYDLSAAAVVLNSPLTLQGGKGAVVKGKFELAPGATAFTVKGITLDGAGELDNAFYVQDGASVISATLSDVAISGYKNRLFYQDKETSTVGSLVISNAVVTDMGTSGDFIDFRKGGLTALKVEKSTFANGIRTFARIDAAVVCNSIVVENNTFFNLCAVDSKDNNGIFHVRSTSVTEAGAITVRNNLFAGMHRAAEEPSNPQGFPKLVSKASSAIALPNFSHNYFSDVDEADEAYSWWAYSAKEVATDGFGVVLTADVFKDAAAGDFTVVHDLVASEKVGDPRWIKHTPAGGDIFTVYDVEGLLGAIAAGKTHIALQYGTYDVTTAVGSDAGSLVLNQGLTLRGLSRNGRQPEFVGGFKLAMTEGSFVLENLKLNGTYTADGAEKKIGNMIDIDGTSVIDDIILKDCEVTGYNNRLVSGSGESDVNSFQVSGLQVHDFGTGGDFIDFRKGAVRRVEVKNNTFANGIRTFVRIDAGVICGAVNVENNTFYNLCAVDSKDNNGIMHVRSTTSVGPASLADAARRIVVRKNIFAAMHRAAEEPSQANGFPKLVSTASEKIAHPYITDNIFFDIETAEGFSWWNTMLEDDIAAAGTVVEDTPFAGDPATGKFTVKAAFKGYGDKRW